MRTFSRDGHFICSIPQQVDANNTKEVKLEALEGHEVTLYDVVSTIYQECFSSRLDEVEKLKVDCQVAVGSKMYRFKVEWYNTFDEYLKEIAGQLKL